MIKSSSSKADIQKEILRLSNMVEETNQFLIKLEKSVSDLDEQLAEIKRQRDFFKKALAFQKDCLREAQLMLGGVDSWALDHRGNAH